MASPRAVVFRNDYVYHLFNRGVERRTIFSIPRDHERFVALLEYYRFHRVPKSYSHYLLLPLGDRAAYRQKLESLPVAVEILAFCLMPNHFHLVVKQTMDGGIHRFLSNIANGYAKYVNTKYHRVGPLYQGPFKAVRVETDDHLVHLSRYLHLNPVVSGMMNMKELASYPWSSFPDYLGKTDRPFINARAVRDHFKDAGEYRDFVSDHVGYAKELEKVKHLVLEEV